MPKKKDVQPVSVRIGNISGVSGEVNVAGGDINIHKTSNGLSAAEIGQLFNQVYSAIETNPKTSPAAREDLKAEVKEIQSSVSEATQKNEKLDEGFLARRFRNIARMAPDVLDVVVATLGNPLAGLGVAVQKIAERAKADTALP